VDWLIDLFARDVWLLLIGTLLAVGISWAFALWSDRSAWKNVQFVVEAVRGGRDVELVYKHGRLVRILHRKVAVMDSGIITGVASVSVERRESGDE